uniref:Uncharacterized protein n=1 Tax=Chromera velia CCMP2878 TaxID=1169474 RepID=A0A0G4GMN6_9ALVE|eukprot:Cvel_22576.t1-p1 / transcript=Cvel_22576.t1 / gene=Cvel_22576 / organism=Chromera_velia_CCMP2878 / gene_product=hypothetical protein / transcript_product=hypothetical protein / location=Cvel_scaffold2231:24055-28034(+) / protein_length=971 / sequence_SO=supercontig / SO=protein_coding / is_pseudo=false
MVRSQPWPLDLSDYSGSRWGCKWIDPGKTTSRTNFQQDFFDTVWIPISHREKTFSPTLDEFKSEFRRFLCPPVGDCGTAASITVEIPEFEDSPYYTLFNNTDATSFNDTADYYRDARAWGMLSMDVSLSEADKVAQLLYKGQCTCHSDLLDLSSLCEQLLYIVTGRCRDTKYTNFRSFTRTVYDFMHIEKTTGACTHELDVIPSCSGTFIDILLSTDNVTGSIVETTFLESAKWDLVRLDDTSQFCCNVTTLDQPPVSLGFVRIYDAIPEIFRVLALCGTYALFSLGAFLCASCGAKQKHRDEVRKAVPRLSKQSMQQTPIQKRYRCAGHYIQVLFVIVLVSLTLHILAVCAATFVFGAALSVALLLFRSLSWGYRKTKEWRPALFRQQLLQTLAVDPDDRGPSVRVQRAWAGVRQCWRVVQWPLTLGVSSLGVFLVEAAKFVLDLLVVRALFTVVMPQLQNPFQEVRLGLGEIFEALRGLKVLFSWAEGISKVFDSLKAAGSQNACAPEVVPSSCGGSQETDVLFSTFLTAITLIAVVILVQGGLLSAIKTFAFAVEQRKLWLPERLPGQRGFLLIVSTVCSFTTDLLVFIAQLALSSITSAISLQAIRFLVTHSIYPRAAAVKELGESEFFPLDLSQTIDPSAVPYEVQPEGPEEAQGDSEKRQQGLKASVMLIKLKTMMSKLSRPDPHPKAKTVLQNAADVFDFTGKNLSILCLMAPVVGGFLCKMTERGAQGALVGARTQTARAIWRYGFLSLVVIMTGLCAVVPVGATLVPGLVFAGLFRVYLHLSAVVDIPRELPDVKLKVMDDVEEELDFEGGALVGVTAMGAAVIAVSRLPANAKNEEGGVKEEQKNLAERQDAEFYGEEKERSVSNEANKEAPGSSVRQLEEEEVQESWGDPVGASVGSESVSEWITDVADEKIDGNGVQTLPYPLRCNPPICFSAEIVEEDAGDRAKQIPTLPELRFRTRS